MAIGNAIVTRAGPALIVKSLEWHHRPQGYKVYNFTVEDNHTYFVGTHNGGVWVHNYPTDSLWGDEDVSGPVVRPPTKHGDLRERMLEQGPPPAPDAQCHHELPWELKEEFAKRGVNVNDVEYGKWVGPDHQSWSQEYNQKWAKWLKDHPDADAQDINRQLERVRRSRRYGGSYLR